MVPLPESVCYNNQYKGVNTAIIPWGLLQAAHSTFDFKNCKQVCRFDGPLPDVNL